jgi:hypothetical protein
MKKYVIAWDCEAKAGGDTIDQYQEHSHCDTIDEALKEINGWEIRRQVFVQSAKKFTLYQLEPIKLRQKEVPSSIFQWETEIDKNT